MGRHRFKRQTNSPVLLAVHQPVPVDERLGVLSSGTQSGNTREQKKAVTKTHSKSYVNGAVKGVVKDAVNGSVNGFSLIEVAVVLALVSLLIWLAVPRYSAQQDQGYTTAMQLELLACVQTLHGFELTASPSAENPWLTLADGDGDGVGDQASGSLADSLCPLSPSTQRAYNVQVQGSEMGFVLRARRLSADLETNSAAGSGSVWAVDHLGRQSWHGDGLAGSGQ